MRRCLRTLDDPLEVGGLENEDWKFVFLLTAALFVLGVLFWDPLRFLCVIAGGILWLVMRAAKAGKPPGYLFYVLYRGGITRLVFWRPARIVPPPLPWEPVAFSRQLRRALTAEPGDGFWPSNAPVPTPDEERASVLTGRPLPATEEAAAAGGGAEGLLEPAPAAPSALGAWIAGWEERTSEVLAVALLLAVVVFTKAAVLWQIEAARMPVYVVAGPMEPGFVRPQAASAATLASMTRAFGGRPGLREVAVPDALREAVLPGREER